MLTVLPTCGFFSGERVEATNACALVGEKVPWQLCAYCSKNPSRPPLPVGPQAEAVMARQLGGCTGCGDPGGLGGR